MSMVRSSTPGLLPESKCLPGRSSEAPHTPSVTAVYMVTGNALLAPVPHGFEIATFAMGCFWCSEGHFASMARLVNSGIFLTRVGYSQGVTPHPTYEEVSSGQTNHAEVVQIIFNPEVRPYVSLLKDFWELHDPTTFMRQGNDVGTQYRSGIYYSTDLQRDLAEKSREAYQKALDEKGLNRPIVTEIQPLHNFFIAEEYHQQYDMKPGSRQYCGMRPTGIELPQF